MRIAANVDPLTRAVLQEARASGLTQAEIEERSGVGRNSLSNWANGRHAPSAAMLHRIMSALGMDAHIVRVIPSLNAIRRAVGR